MDWTQLDITINVNDIEAASAIAHMAVPYGIYIEDYSDLEQTTALIAHTTAKSGIIDKQLIDRDRTTAIIHIYISPEDNPAESAAFLRARLDSADIDYSIAMSGISEQDWANNWKQYFKPDKVGDKLLICPTWLDPPPTQGRKLLRIDPGMAFGTGGHETTRLVLEIMERYITPGCSLLDVGCGSGILSIAARLLGADSVLGIDIDSTAVRTAVENGEVNGMSPPEYVIKKGDLAVDVSGRYDVIIANIVADAIIALSPAVPPLLAEGGIYIVSGIIDTKQQQVIDAVTKMGFLLKNHIKLNNWVALELEMR